MEKFEMELQQKNEIAETESKLKQQQVTMTSMGQSLSYSYIVDSQQNGMQ